MVRTRQFVDEQEIDFSAFAPINYHEKYDRVKEWVEELVKQIYLKGDIPKIEGCIEEIAYFYEVEVPKLTPAIACPRPPEGGLEEEMFNLGKKLMSDNLAEGTQEKEGFEGDFFKLGVELMKETAKKSQE